MGIPDRFTKWNARADDWLLAHPLAFFLVLAVPPALAVTGLEVIRGSHALDGFVLGTVFGLTFASVSVFLRRRRS